MAKHIGENSVAIPSAILVKNIQIDALMFYFNDVTSALVTISKMTL